MSESAERAPEPTSVEKWLRQFEGDYSQLSKRAAAAAETTSTAAWAANYQYQVKLHEQTEGACVKDLENSIESLKLNGTNEELEKTMRDAIKSLADERVKYGAWKMRSIENYRRAALGLSDFIDGIVAKARKEERENPLLNRDFERDVKLAIAGWMNAKWDDQSGQVVLV